MKTFRDAAACLVLASLAVLPGLDQARAACADVALVLAVDGSGSVDTGEFAFQKTAIATSLRDPDVLDVIQKAGMVSVAVIFWGDPERRIQETPAVIIERPADADRLARMVEGLPREVLGGTGLGNGIIAALGKLMAMGCAHRQIINVSGDGKESIIYRRKYPYITPRTAKAMAEASGVTINALAISNAESTLANYYELEVITGPNAFVMEVGSYADYAEALRLKLIREITPLTLSQRQ
jgi:hypothetical protein